MPLMIHLAAQLQQGGHASRVCASKDKKPVDKLNSDQQNLSSVVAVGASRLANFSGADALTSVGTAVVSFCGSKDGF